MCEIYKSSQLRPWKERQGTLTIEELLNRNTDKHEPGHEQAEKIANDDIASTDVWTDMDTAWKEMEEALLDAERNDSLTPEQKLKKQKSAEPGKEAARRSAAIEGEDIAEPVITWQQILERLVKAAERQSNEETRTKMNPMKSGIAATELHRTGTAIIPPVNPLEPFYPKVFFIIDTSGSMMHITKAIQNKVKTLVSSQTLRKCVFAVMRFCVGHEMFYGRFSTDEAAIVHSIKEKPKLSKTPSLTQMLQISITGGTVFSDEIKNIALDAVKQGYNLIITSDADIAQSQNLLDIYNSNRRRVFMVWDCQHSYQTFMKFAKLNSTTTITYFGAG